MENHKLKRQKFLKDKAGLWWWVKDATKLSDGALLEGTLNYGEWEDVLEVFNILGLKKAAAIFKKQIAGKRINYRPKTLNYFKLYFKEYASGNSKRKS
jgi:hypothetical protein